MTERGYKVVTNALRVEAQKWDGFAESVAPIHRTVEAATLDVSAFFIGDPAITMLDATVHHSCYQSYQQYMERLVSGAKDEFPQIANALIKIANAYDQAESDTIELKLGEIYSE